MTDHRPESGLPDGVPRPRIISGVGRGWWPLVTEVHEKLLALDPDYTVDQVKEKFGGLRFYFTASARGHAGAMEAVVDDAEARSLTMCEWCGKPSPGPRRKAGTEWGWVLTLCEDHQRERDYGPVY